VTENDDNKTIDLLADFLRDLKKLEFPKEGMIIAAVDEDTQRKWLSGVPFIQCCPPKIDAQYFLEFARRVKDLAVIYDEDCQEGLDQVLQALDNEEGIMEQLVSGVFSSDQETISDIVNDLGVDSQDFSFLVNHATHPIFLEFARLLKPSVDLVYWDKGYCPFCGSPAHLARLDGDTRKRYLYCARCDTEWSFKRLSCPRCLNENPEDLQFFTVEGSEKYRVYTCAKCRGYVKTVVEDEKGPRREEMFLEELRTVGLDVLAAKENYVPPISREGVIK